MHTEAILVPGWSLPCMQKGILCLSSIVKIRVPHLVCLCDKKKELHINPKAVFIASLSRSVIMLLNDSVRRLVGIYPLVTAENWELCPMERN